MGRGPHKKTAEKIQNSSQVDESLIQEVFNFWKTTHSKRVTAMDHTRRRNIGNAISLYGVEGCKQAIIGCTYSDFHMGRNKHNRKYNDIELILRDVEHIERFIGYLPEGFDGGGSDTDPF